MTVTSNDSITLDAFLSRCFLAGESGASADFAPSHHNQEISIPICGYFNVTNGSKTLSYIRSNEVRRFRIGRAKALKIDDFRLYPGFIKKPV